MSDPPTDAYSIATEKKNYYARKAERGNKYYAVTE
jgi:hypothetical protein